MGLTYARSFLQSQISGPDELMILEKSPERAERLAQQESASIFEQPGSCVPQADLIVLAVKPQDCPVLFPSLSPWIEQRHLLLSIMAGVSIARIRAGTGAYGIVRAMPNLPAQIGKGMTAFTCSTEVSRPQLMLVQNLLTTTGKALLVERESMLDATTAISGSGPAYVWFFMQSMIEKAKGLGFSSSEAELLVSETFLGAMELYQTHTLGCAEWISKVASRGGTTEAALQSFQEDALPQRISAGLQAALLRARDLGKLP